MHAVQKRTLKENDKLIFRISDEINGNLFLLEENHCDYITGPDAQLISGQISISRKTIVILKRER